ncbi:MAG: Rrf2 family transcriptional regulator [Firmicutes bacterium]|nr:Rrf2 family transcriptional regulator [Bacillota bacterium]
MKISTKGRYALRLMICLGTHADEGSLSLKRVSVEEGITVKYLEHITGMLTKAGLVESVRGARGGYKLTRDMKDYTVTEILEASEGLMVPVACLDPGAEMCPRRGKCSTIKFWEGMYKALTEYTDSITLEDLVEDHEECLAAVDGF